MLSLIEPLEADGTLVKRSRELLEAEIGNFFVVEHDGVIVGCAALYPFPGEFGKRLWENVSKEAWAQWLKQQTMLVNENRLNLADPKARKYLMEQTERHFFGTGADTASGYVPPPK